ncbi:MAG TPA: MipA/OmpV family protein [Burkholderiales bacterium]|nr:MipA/OmpV family protein [Burkholderiales bacterium]
MMRLAPALAALCLLPGLAQAQDGERLLGAGLRTRPAYDGAERRNTDLVPVLRYYGSPWFARTTQGILEGGARVALAPGLAAGAQLAYEAGPLDGDAGASLGVHLEWDWKIFNLLGRFRRHLDGERGTQSDLRATMGVYGSHGVRAGVFAQATWANAQHTQAYYGVRESGLLFTGLGVLGSVEISRRWLGVASLEARRLDAAVARSAFVERRSGTYASAGLAYRF